MATISESVQNAMHNFKNLNLNELPGMTGMLLKVIKSQINNAGILLSKGYPADTDIEELLEDYSSIDEIPDYEE